MSNFWNYLKALTLANQNLAKADPHVGHCKKICWKPGQKPPKIETKSDKSRCMSHICSTAYLVDKNSFRYLHLNKNEA